MGVRNILQKLRGSSDKSLSTKDVISKIPEKLTNAAKNLEDYHYTKKAIKKADIAVSSAIDHITIDIYNIGEHKFGPLK